MTCTLPQYLCSTILPHDYATMILHYYNYAVVHYYTTAPLYLCTGTLPYDSAIIVTHYYTTILLHYHTYELVHSNLKKKERDWASRGRPSCNGTNSVASKILKEKQKNHCELWCKCCACSIKSSYATRIGKIDVAVYIQVGSYYYYQDCQLATTIITATASLQHAYYAYMPTFEI